MAKTPGLIGNQRPRQASKAATAGNPGSERKLKWFRVTSGGEKGHRIPRPHGDFLLRQGKEINDANFEIPRLLNLGVKLEEIPTPGWFVKQQADAQEKYLRLVDEGVELPEPPEYEVPPAPSPAAPAA